MLLKFVSDKSIRDVWFCQKNIIFSMLSKIKVDIMRKGTLLMITVKFQTCNTYMNKTSKTVFWTFCEKKLIALLTKHFPNIFSGRSNLICMEDLIHEIFTVGTKFKYASNFLWPFKVIFVICLLWKNNTLRHWHDSRISLCFIISYNVVEQYKLPVTLCHDYLW